MSYDEFLTIVKVLKGVYTQENFLPDKEAIDLWYSLLKDLPLQEVKKSVYYHLSKGKFPPTIAHIREGVGKLNTQPSNWGSAWQSVLKAVGSYGIWDKKNALESMDERTRKAVENLGWETICMSEDIAIERANFRMIYEQEFEREKDEKSLPPALKSIFSGMLMIGGNEIE